MPNRHKKKQSSRTQLKDFVTVAFAEDMDLAKHYKKILSEEDIPVAIKTQTDPSNFSGIAIMVPEDHLDIAHVLIESQDEYNDFYDMVFNEDEFSLDGEDLDEEYFDEQF